MFFETPFIRNLVISGHKGTGKSTIFEQILFNVGAIDKAEKIESGKTVSDFSEDEINRKHSVYSALANIVWNTEKMNFLDTPGSSSYIGELISSLRACESALVVIDGKNGLQIETLKIWRQLDTREKPRAIFINKMDIMGADYFGIIDDLRQRFKKNFIPVSIPIGSGESYQGMINLIIKKAFLIDDGSDKDRPSEIPADMVEIVNKYREEMIELAAEGDDKLIEKYFNDGTLSEDDIRLGISLGMKNSKVVPVMCGCADKNNGIASFLNFLSIVAPSPENCIEKAKNQNSEEDEIFDVKIDSGKEFSAMVFKTKIDKFSGKMSYIKVITGSLTPDMEFHNVRTGLKIRASKIYTCIGKKLIEVEKLSAGDLGILVKVEDLNTNDTISDLKLNYNFLSLKLPHPAYSLAIFSNDKKDDDKLNELLTKIAEQDLIFSIKFNKETKENVISGVDEQHLNLILENSAIKYKIEFKTQLPKIAYRETITKNSESEYAHKKQSGGHGQYGKVLIKFEPLERGKFFEFRNEVKGGAVGKNYMPGVEKGLLEAMEIGFLAGFPIVDIKATIVDGKEHPVDSSEMAFKLAARGALRDALKRADAVILEPIMLLKVYTEEQYVGNILSDLSSKRGRVLKQDSLGDMAEINAEVPEAELSKYAIDLKSITSGTASFELEFSHYNPISGKLAETIIEQSKFNLTNDD